MKFSMASSLQLSRLQSTLRIVLFVAILVSIGSYWILINLFLGAFLSKIFGFFVEPLELFKTIINYFIRRVLKFLENWARNLLIKWVTFLSSLRLFIDSFGHFIKKFKIYIYKFELVKILSSLFLDTLIQLYSFYDELYLMPNIVKFLIKWQEFLFIVMESCLSIGLLLCFSILSPISILLGFLLGLYFYNFYALIKYFYMYLCLTYIYVRLSVRIPRLYDYIRIKRILGKKMKPLALVGIYLVLSFQAIHLTQSQKMDHNYEIVDKSSELFLEAQSTSKWNNFPLQTIEQTFSPASKVTFEEPEVVKKLPLPPISSPSFEITVDSFLNNPEKARFEVFLFYHTIQDQIKISR